MTDDDSSRISKPTAGAQRALGLAQLVNKVFAKERIVSTIAGHAGYRVEMSPPEGMSTTSRKGAVDQLKLVPVDPAATGGSEGGSDDHHGDRGSQTSARSSCGHTRTSGGFTPIGSRGGRSRSPRPPTTPC